MQRKNLLGNTLLLFTSMIWGFAFTAQKLSGEAFSTAFVVSARFFLGTLVLIPSVLFLDRLFRTERNLFSRKNPHFLDITKWELLGGFICGMILVSATTLQQIGLIYASPGKASFLTALYVVFVPFIIFITTDYTFIIIYILSCSNILVLQVLYPLRH